MLEANLSRASLQQADLRGADMLGVDLREANLQGLWLDETAKFDEKTILPDAEFIGSDENDYPLYDKHWTPDTDMSRYTDPNHPDFWQPEWAKKRHGDSQQQ